MADVEAFLGDAFGLPDRFNSRRLLRFAALAATGIDDSDPIVLNEVDKMLDHVLREEDRQRFDDLCDEQGVGLDELLEFVMGRVAVLSGRPTVRPSASAPGPSSTSDDSADASSSRVVSRLESRGRGDLALMVTKAQEARSLASA